MGPTIVVVRGVLVVLVGLVAIAVVIICPGNIIDIGLVLVVNMPMMFDWLWRIK